VLRRLLWKRRKLERYTPPNFCSSFSLSIIDDHLGTIKGLVDSTDGKLWKKTMIEELVTLYKNAAVDLVELLARRNPIVRK